jgi:hypothetical protein
VLVKTLNNSCQRAENDKKILALRLSQVNSCHEFLTSAKLSKTRRELGNWPIKEGQFY